MSKYIIRLNKKIIFKVKPLVSWHCCIMRRELLLLLLRQDLCCLPWIENVLIILLKMLHKKREMLMRAYYSELNCLILWILMKDQKLLML